MMLSCPLGGAIHSPCESSRRVGFRVSSMLFKAPHAGLSQETGASAKAPLGTASLTDLQGTLAGSYSAFLGRTSVPS